MSTERSPTKLDLTNVAVVVEAELDVAIFVAKTSVAGAR